MSIVNDRVLLISQLKFEHNGTCGRLDPDGGACWCPRRVLLTVQVDLGTHRVLPSGVKGLRLMEMVMGVPEHTYATFEEIPCLRKEHKNLAEYGEGGVMPSVHLSSC